MLWEVYNFKHASDPSTADIWELYSFESGPSCLDGAKKSRRKSGLQACRAYKYDPTEPTLLPAAGSRDALLHCVHSLLI